jgi:hypothetical protein
LHPLAGVDQSSSLLVHQQLHIVWTCEPLIFLLSLAGTLEKFCRDQAFASRCAPKQVQSELRQSIEALKGDELSW